MKKIFLILTTLTLSLSLFSCMTIKEIPADKTAAQILQLGQNAASTRSFKNAEFCFNTVLDRFGSDPLTFVQATYELGHIYTKQKKYEKATKAFNDILAVSDATMGAIPPKYKKLATIGLERIAEETAPKIKK